MIQGSSIVPRQKRPFYNRVVAVFRKADGTEITVNRMVLIKFTGDDDGALRLIAIKTLALDLASQFSQGMEGTLQERFTESSTGVETILDTPGLLKVVSVLPCLAEKSIATATINFVPCLPSAPETEDPRIRTGFDIEGR